MTGLWRATWTWQTLLLPWTTLLTPVKVATGGGEVAFFRKLTARLLYGLTEEHFSYIDVTTTVLKTQGLLGGQDLTQAALQDKWVAGYIYGAHCALLQYRGIEPGPEAMDYLERSYGFVFGTRQEGRAMFDQAIQLQGDPRFDKGNQEGGDDVFNWLRTRQPTLRLARHLRA